MGVVVVILRHVVEARLEAADSGKCATPPLQKLNLVMQDTSFHDARNGDYPASYVPGELVGCKRDDLASHVLGSGHLPERHRARDPLHVSRRRRGCRGRVRRRPAGSRGR